MVAIMLDLPALLAVRVDHWFRRLQLLSAAAYSLGHGGNDAQKTMGIIAGVLFAGGYMLRRSASDLLGRSCCARRDRARHAVGRLAHHPHDGIEDHEAAAGGRLRRRDRPAPSRSSSPRTSACRSAPRTRSPARSSASAATGACPPSAGASPGGSSGPGCSRFPRPRSSRPSSTSSSPITVAP